MRFIAILRGNAQLSLPLAHHYAVQSFIYNALSRDPAYSAALHDIGYNSGSRTFRLFTFGPLTGTHCISTGRILFPGEFSLEVRSPVSEIIMNLAAALIPGSAFDLDGQAVTVVESRLQLGAVGTDRARIRMLSPIVAHRTTPEKKTRYYAPDEPEFAELINRNFSSKYEAFTGKAPGSGIDLTPVNVGQRDKEVTRYKGFYITGWRGEYLLSGKPEHLDFLYETGLGAKNAQGFGMFELARA